MYHAENSLYFERLHDGSVRIVKTDGRAPDAVGAKVLWEQTLPPNLWASAVLSMSKFGERPNDFHAFLDHHHGRSDLIARARG